MPAHDGLIGATTWLERTGATGGYKAGSADEHRSVLVCLAPGLRAAESKPGKAQPAADRIDFKYTLTPLDPFADGNQVGAVVKEVRPGEVLRLTVTGKELIPEGEKARRDREDGADRSQPHRRAQPPDPLAQRRGPRRHVTVPGGRWLP